jgi:hypothetical protein
MPPRYAERLYRQGGRIARAVSRRWAANLPVGEPPWDALDREFGRWREPGPVFWWRDDDAIESTAASARLLALRERLALPLGLAVIPALVKPSLPRAVAATPPDAVGILVHGWNHVNHAPADAVPSELAASRDAAEVAAQLSQGRRRLGRLFGDRLCPVLVPPFNQISHHLVGTVSAAGFTHVSIDRDFAALGIATRNVHADIMDWDRRTAVSAATLARDILGALRLRRYGLVEKHSPIGILTHHLAHDEAAWSVAEELLERLSRYLVVSFPPVSEIFAS